MRAVARSVVRHDFNEVLVEWNARIRSFEMECLGSLPVLKKADHLEHAGHSGGRFEMTNVGFDPADEEFRFSVWTKDGIESFHLRGISGLSAGSMGFDRVDLVQRNPGLFVNASNGFFLSAAVWERYAVRAAVLIDSRGADDGVDAISVAQRVAEVQKKTPAPSPQA